VASFEGDKLVVPYINILVHLKSGLLRGVTSFERGKLVVFSYLSTTDIWPVNNIRGVAFREREAYNRETTILPKFI
jgi:hypothetical protein